MNATQAALSGIPPQFLYTLANGTVVSRDMFVSYGPDANCTISTCPISWTVYQYRPSLAANTTFIVLFFLAMLIHIYLGIRWRCYAFATFISIGCIWAMIGYAGRVMLWVNPWSFAGFLMQIICTTGSPVFFTAAIYVTLSRAISYYAPELSRLPPKVFYWGFICFDILCLVLQAIGGALSSQSDGSSQTGIDVAMAGLILQVIVLVIFCAFFVDYMVRYVKRERKRTGSARQTIKPRQQLFLAALALSIVLILIRCGYRVDELSEGYQDSTKITHEGMFIGFEGVLIVAAVCCLFVGHPGFGFKHVEVKSADSGMESGDSAEPKTGA